MTTTMRLKAVLIPDEGRSVLAEDYFRSAHHLRSEGVTHTLLVDGGEGGALRIPLIVRPIEGAPYRDAISPYGYPGGGLSGLSEVPKDAVDWRGTDLVSIFVRDRIGGPYCFAGGTVRSEVCIIDSTQPVKFRKDRRADIRRNIQLGYVTTSRPVRECSREDREVVQEIYRQTMARNGASSRYLFSEAWFEEAFSSPAAWLVTTRAPDGQVASWVLAVLSDGYLHNFLGATADAYVAHSPSKNDIPVLVELSAKLGVPLHMGGGVRPGDSLEQFKRGFANASALFYTHEIICDPARYASLSAESAETSYFPAYRATQR